MTALPELSDIKDAIARLSDYAVVTPLMESQILNDHVGGRILIKAEMFQRTGSFKFRGALNRISKIDSQKFSGGVITCSSGNHAQGVAEAARICGLSSTIIMPSDAPQIKKFRTLRSGAQIITYDRMTEDREAIARDLAGQRQCDFVAPYDDPLIIAGQGTAGFELAEQAKKQNATLDLLLCPCGGGGLISGIGLYLRHAYPGLKIFAVEPEGFDDTARSLGSGQREVNERPGGSICDALLSVTPGEITFELNKKQLSGGLVVSDEQVKRAMKFAFEELKLVVEPGGAVALAAILNGLVELENKTTAIILSGGNVDADFYSNMLLTA